MSICPYLRSADGTWRSTQPQSDHRCWAQLPPAVLANVTQARLCLTPGHTTCEYYAAAVNKRTAELERDHIPAERLAGRFNPQVQPVALALDASPAASGGPAQPPARRAMAPVLLAGLGLVLVVVALGYIAFGEHGPGPTPTVAITPAPSLVAVASPTDSPPPTSAPSPTPSPSIAPSSSPSSSLPPGIARTYVVKSGDTIHSIAHRFHLTRARLIAANDLGDPPTITPGQVLFIPYPHGQGPTPAPS
jgi:LysM repeat protein